MLLQNETKVREFIFILFKKKNVDLIYTQLEEELL